MLKFKNLDLNVDVLIQARMGSTRLPGKVLMPLGEATVLDAMISRVKRTECIRNIVIVTSEASFDNEIAAFAEKNDILCFRGSEDDLLERYYKAALYFETDIIVRLTGDCPLIDPQIIDDMVRLFLFNWPNMEFLTNCFKRTFARGMDVEIIAMKTLEWLYHNCKKDYYREHVVPYIEENTDKFAFFEFPNTDDHSEFRLTIDTPEDYETITGLLEILQDQYAGYSKIIDCLKKHREIIKNMNVTHKEYQK